MPLDLAVARVLAAPDAPTALPPIVHGFSNFTLGLAYVAAWVVAMMLIVGAAAAHEHWQNIKSDRRQHTARNDARRRLAAKARVTS